MTVRHLVTRVGQYDVEGIGYAPEGRVSQEGQEASLAANPDLEALVEVMAVCNDSEIAQEDGHWKVIGEPTEGALRTLGRKAEVDRANYQRLAVVPFEWENKVMATLGHVRATGLRITLTVAPDRWLRRC